VKRKVVPGEVFIAKAVWFGLGQGHRIAENSTSPGGVQTDLQEEMVAVMSLLDVQVALVSAEWHLEVPPDRPERKVREGESSQSVQNS